VAGASSALTLNNNPVPAEPLVVEPAPDVHSIQRQQLRKLWNGLAWGLAKVVAGLLLVCTVIGGGVTVLSLYTRLEVEPGDRLNPDDPFTELFTIQNLGLLPVEVTKISCLVNYAHFSNGDSMERVNGHTSRPPRSLQSNAKFSAFCRPYTSIRPAKLDFADVGLAVSYRPAWANWLPTWMFEHGNSEVVRRFGTARKKDGSLFWTPKDLPER
jgi:hypothetical protein